MCSEAVAKFGCMQIYCSLLAQFELINRDLSSKFNKFKLPIYAAVNAASELSSDRILDFNLAARVRESDRTYGFKC